MTNEPTKPGDPGPSVRPSAPAAEPYAVEPFSPSPSGASAPRPATGKLDAPPLIEGFEEDVDFTHDPEVEAALKGKPVGASKVRVVGDEGTSQAPRPDFVRPGLGGPKVWAIVGAVLLAAALVAVGVTSKQSASKTTASVFLTLYNVLLHTGTGVVAVWIASVLTERRLGRFELAAARMFTAVAALTFFYSLRVSLFSTSKFEQDMWSAFLGAAGYVGAVAGLFRIWGPSLAFVIGSHLALWLLVQVGMLLSALAAPLPPA